MDDNPDDRAVLGVADRTDHLGDRALTVDDDATAEAVEDFRRWIAVQECLVLLLDPKAGVHDTMGDLAIVCQQQQPLGLAIEPSDWHDALVDRHEVHDGVAAALVGGGRDVATRLVEQNVASSNCRDQLTVDLDLLCVGVNLAAEFGDDLAINADTPFEDQFFGAPTGGYTGRSQHSLQSFHVAVLSGSCRVRHDRPAAD